MFCFFPEERHLTGEEGEQLYFKAALSEHLGSALSPLVTPRDQADPPHGKEAPAPPPPRIWDLGLWPCGSLRALSCFVSPPSAGCNVCESHELFTRTLHDQAAQSCLCIYVNVADGLLL